MVGILWEDKMIFGLESISMIKMRKLVKERCRKKGVTQKICWAKPELSGDNACGVALIGEEMLLNNK